MAKAAPKSPRGPHGILTWLASGLGFLVIAAALVVVAMDAFDQASPARVVAEETGRATLAGTTVIEIEVRNLGGEAAGAVEVEGLPQTGEPGHVSLDYVASRSTRTATLSFPGDPGRVMVVVRGWTDP